MKKTLLFSAAALAISLQSFAPATSWELDKSHAKLGFSIVHMMVSDVEGSFKIQDATITSSKPDFSDAVVTLTADAKSVNTDFAARDEHLRGADFFDVDKYPTISYKSTSFKKAKSGYVVNGNLTMHGITKPVTLNMTAAKGTNPYSKKDILGFRVKGIVNRTDFGVGTSMGDAMLSNKVNVNANIEFNSK
jgi:polyisoprenoid-binding protein YceI